MTCKEHHRIGRRTGSLEGCWILACGIVTGGNTKGAAGRLPWPAGAARKAKQGMQSKSRYARKVNKGIIPKPTLDLGSPCAHWKQIQNQKSKIKNFLKTP